jgi:hypothetical protein
MKSKLQILAALGLLSTLSPQLSTAHAQQYSVDWFTIDGGGGTSTGGVFTVSGTIGQPDAGQMSGGTYTLSGGFWGIIAAVQTPGAPGSPSRSNMSLVVSRGWVLKRRTPCRRRPGRNRAAVSDNGANLQVIGNANQPVLPAVSRSPLFPANGEARQLLLATPAACGVKASQPWSGGAVAWAS